MCDARFRVLATIFGVVGCALATPVASASQGTVASAFAGTTVEGREGATAIRAGVGRTRLVQGEMIRELTQAALSVDSLRVGGIGSARAGVSGWIERAGPGGFGGFVALERAVDEGPTLSASMSRDPVWRSPPGSDPLQGLRVRDLRRLDRGLTATDARLSATLTRGEGSRLSLELGGTRFSDGNGRVSALGRLRLPIASSRAVSFALEPSVYSETFSRKTTGFHTPRGYASVVLGLRVGAGVGAFTFDASLDPHAFRHSDFEGVGLGGALTSSIDLGRATIRMSSEFLHQAAHRYVQLAWGLRLSAR